MSSFLFCTSYFDKDVMSCHPLRYKKWIDYYSKLMEDLGVDFVFLIDDGSLNPTLENSSVVEIHAAEDDLPAELSKKVNIITFKEHLGRPSQDEYLGWWRSFTYSIKIAEKYGFRKIVHIESDFYIVSDRLIRYIHSLNKGWTSLFSSHLNFPETAIQIICQDSFHLLEKVRSQVVSSNYKMDQIAELFLPFTNVCKDFNGDRASELAVLIQWMSGENGINDLDYYGQLPTYVKPLSAPEAKKLMHSIGTTVNMNATINEELLIDIMRKNNVIVTPS